MIDECRMLIEEDYGKSMGRKERVKAGPKGRKGREDKEGESGSRQAPVRRPEIRSSVGGE